MAGEEGQVLRAAARSGATGEVPGPAGVRVARHSIAGIAASESGAGWWTRAEGRAMCVAGVRRQAAKEEVDRAPCRAGRVRCGAVDSVAGRGCQAE